MLLGRAGTGAQTDSELHQTGREGSVRPGVDSGVTGGFAGVPPDVQSPSESVYL